ncbi:MAG: HNH endonuclease [Methylibium sp.]
MSAPAYAPKFSKFPTGRTLAEDRAAVKRAGAAQLDAAHAIVDARDGRRCRVCRRPCLPGAVKRSERAERHHLIPRSRGGAHVPENLVTLCVEECHPAVHVLGVLRLSGNAETRDEHGRFNGVKVERLYRESWRVIGWR